MGMKKPRAACLELSVALCAREGSFLVSLRVQALEVVEYRLQMNKKNENKPTNKPITQSEKENKQTNRNETKKERK